jgi:hypothetical protein
MNMGESLMQNLCSKSYPAFENKAMEKFKLELAIPIEFFFISREARQGCKACTRGVYA